MASSIPDRVQSSERRMADGQAPYKPLFSPLRRHQRQSGRELNLPAAAVPSKPDPALLDAARRRVRKPRIACVESSDEDEEHGGGDVAARATALAKADGMALNKAAFQGDLPAASLAQPAPEPAASAAVVSPVAARTQSSSGSNQLNDRALPPSCTSAPPAAIPAGCPLPPSDTPALRAALPTSLSPSALSPTGLSPTGLLVPQPSVASPLLPALPLPQHMPRAARAAATAPANAAAAAASAASATVAHGQSATEEEEEEDVCCGICLQSITARGLLERCDHAFCAPCILRWALCATNRCPFCASRFHSVFNAETGERTAVLDRERQVQQLHGNEHEPLRRATAPARASGVRSGAGGGGPSSAPPPATLSAEVHEWDAQLRRMAEQHRHVSPWQIAIALWQGRGLPTAAPLEPGRAARYEGGNARGGAGGSDGEGSEGSESGCVACGQPGLLLLCDRCNDPWHLGCLPVPLAAVPAGEWLCPWCAELRRLVVSDTLAKARAPSLGAARFRIPKRARPG
jgi:hypothetical protein